MNKPLLFVLGQALAAASPAWANQLANPGFESPISLPQQADDAWFYVSETIYWDCGEAHSGRCSAMLASDPLNRTRDVLWQDFSSVAGQGYTLSFFVKTNRNAINPASDFGQVTFSVPGGSIGSAPPYPAATTFTSNAGWQRVDYGFTATGSSSRISFKGLGFANDRIGNYINIDDVSISAAVPEPGTAALLLAGVGVLAMALRRRAPGAR